MQAMVLPSSTGISSITLQVPNVGESLLFYRDLLGFVVKEVGGSRTTLSPGQHDAPVVFLIEKRNAIPRPPRTTGLFHVAFLFPGRKELAEAFQRLYEHGWPFQGYADHGVSEALYLADPHGNGIELYADRPRDQWPYRNGELQMVTAPLDLDSLLAEIGTKEEAALSAGSPRIGHIHLNVSDLGKAKRFYHDLLGFAVTQETFPGALFVAAGGYHHHLGLNVWNGRGAPGAPPETIGLVQFGIQVPDNPFVRRLAARFQEEGIPVEIQSNGFVTRDFDGISIIIHP